MLNIFYETNLIGNLKTQCDGKKVKCTVKGLKNGKDI